MKKFRANQESGFVLVTTILMLSLFLTLFAAYYTTTNIETATYKYQRGSSSGFFSSEAGLNLRAETIRQIFVGFNRPAGTSPTSTTPCTGSNMGGGDYQCRNYTFNNRDVKSYVTEDASNPVILTIPPGERYQNLNAQEYRYTAHSTAWNRPSNYQEADLELRFKSRLVPLFQFAAFYNKDLEILPGPAMTLSGPVHTNGSLWLYSSSANLDISGQITAAGEVWRGRKDNSITPSCSTRPVNVMDPGALRSLIPNCTSRYQTTTNDLQPFNGMIQKGVQPVTVPGPDVFDPTPGKIYWDRADLRLVLVMNASNVPTGVEVRQQNDTRDNSASTTLNGCTGSVSGRAVGFTQFYNYREAKWIYLLDMDLIATLNCLRNSNWFGTGKLLSDPTEGGLVFHMTVKGPQAASTANNYGIRVRNADRIYSTVAGAPLPRGFTLVSDQAAYTLGNFNRTNKIPAAIMADSLNILSSAWNNGGGTDAGSNGALGTRIAATTTINSAFLAGTDSTGGIEGSGGINGYYNGGLENYPRFHEDWSGRVLTYRGSFVSLGRAQHVAGRWSAQSYSPPNRDWNYDTSFNNAANLPPITPRFVYLKQELFVRDFDG